MEVAGSLQDGRARRALFLISVDKLATWEDNDG